MFRYFVLEVFRFIIIFIHFICVWVESTISSFVAYRFAEIRFCQCMLIYLFVLLILNQDHRLLFAAWMPQNTPSFTFSVFISNLENFLDDFGILVLLINWILQDVLFQEPLLLDVAILVFANSLFIFHGRKSLEHGRHLHPWPRSFDDSIYFVFGFVALSAFLLARWFGTVPLIIQ